MTTNQTPLLAIDNVFDRINLYQYGTYLSSSAGVGFEEYHVASYRREKGYWQPQTDAGLVLTGTLETSVCAPNLAVSVLTSSTVTLKATFVTTAVSGDTLQIYRNGTLIHTYTLNSGDVSNGFVAFPDSSSITASTVYLYAVTYTKTSTSVTSAASATVTVTTPASGSGSPVAAANTSVLTLTATTLTGSLVNGDTFTLGGVSYQVQGLGIAAANLVTVTVAPAVASIQTIGATISAYTPLGNWVGINVAAQYTGPSPTPTSQFTNFCWIDRGSNLFNVTLHIEYSSTGTTWTTYKTYTTGTTFQAMQGNDPTAGFSATEEGAIYTVWTNTTIQAPYWRLRVGYVATFVAIVTGIVLGQAYQLGFYSKVLDEDAGDRIQPQDQSQAGWQSSQKTYAWRTLKLDLGVIGSVTYDNQVRAVRAPLFQQNQPCVIFMNYGTYPERGWLYRLDQTSYSFAASRSFRAGVLTFRELYQLVN